MNEFWFTSTLFDIELGEDEETNPQCYGKNLSTWLKKKLGGIGYTVEDVIPEDWGWCVMYCIKPYFLWVGCGCVVESDPVENTVPNKNEITWHCFVVAEVPFWKKIFGKIDTAENIKKLSTDLESILVSEPGITIVTKHE